MNEKIEIEVKYSDEEYIRGMLFSQRKNSFYRYNFLIIVVSGLIGFIGFYYFIHKGDISWDSDLLLKFLLALILIIPIGYLLKDFSSISEKFLKKQYDSAALLQEKYKITFDAEGINSESNSFAEKLRWNAVIKAVQTDEDFHFFVPHNASLFIPKRVFTDEQQDEMKNLAKRKLSDNAKF